MSTRYGLEIRAADAADAPGLAELLAGLWAELRAAVDPATQPRALAARLEAMRQERGAVLLALEYGPPSGVIALHWHRTLAADLPVAMIDTLYVAQDARRRGIGRMLLKAGAQAARAAGCGALELLATPDDDSLRAFCLATGFVPAGARFGRALRKKG